MTTLNLISAGLTATAALATPAMRLASTTWPSSTSLWKRMRAAPLCLDGRVYIPAPRVVPLDMQDRGTFFRILLKRP